MIIDVKPGNFCRHKCKDGPFMVFYSYEHNILNKLLSDEIVKTDKKYLILNILKINWLEQKKFTNSTDDAECNRVLLYYKREIIFDYCPPDLGIQLPEMFHKCKELYDFETAKNSFNYTMRETNFEKHSSNKVPNQNLKMDNIQYIPKITICKRISNYNKCKTGDLANEIKGYFPKNIQQKKIVQKINNNNIIQKDKSKKNLLSKREIKKKSCDQILNAKKDDKGEILPDTRNLMKYYFESFCHENFNECLKNRNIGVYTLNRLNKRFISKKKSKKGIIKKVDILVENTQKEK